MAQDNYINVVSGIKLTGNGYSHALAHGSIGSGDMTISWDHTKFTSKTSLRDALRKVEAFFDSRGDLAT